MEESIADYFNDRALFITGGTGFMGKVLIEKLLRSCPGINKIYILMRPSKQGNLNERIQHITSLSMFNRLRSERPGDIEKKLYPIEGDMKKLGLGISTEDRKLLTDNVSVIFHAAASVRFNDPLNEAILINTRGTREVVKLAKELKNISVFVHVSTTYCNCYRKIVEETIYPAPFDWRHAIYTAENADFKTMNILTEKYLEPFPNSYVFAKNLTEQLLKDECKNIPTVIFRPSIVIASVEEPVPGWMDTFYGPVGLILGIGKGVVRCVITRGDIRPDYMPVDISIKGMIVAAWKKGHLDSDKLTISVYNSSSGNKSITMNELVNMGMKYCYKYPFTQSIWVPTIMFTTDKTCFYVNTIIKQFIPAVVIDLWTRFTNKKSWYLVKLQRKIFQAALALSHFTAKNWIFINNNFLELIKYIPPTDKKDFDFNFENIKPEEYFCNAILGGHQYLLKTDLSMLPAVAAQQKKLKVIHNTLKIIFWIFIIWYLYKTATPYFDFV